jgi:hypothetical protein
LAPLANSLATRQATPRLHSGLLPLAYREPDDEGHG